MHIHRLLLMYTAPKSSHFETSTSFPSPSPYLRTRGPVTSSAIRHYVTHNTPAMSISAICNTSLYTQMSRCSVALQGFRFRVPIVCITSSLRTESSQIPTQLKQSNARILLLLLNRKHAERQRSMKSALFKSLTQTFIIPVASRLSSFMTLSLFTPGAKLTCS